MPLTLENLDNISYKEILENAGKLIPVYAPAWTNHNISDPGITFLELFAWLAEMQIYSLNKITPRAERKFLRLTGIQEPQFPKPAGVTLEFTSKPEIKENVTIKAKTQVLVSQSLPGQDLVFETKNEITVEPDTDNPSTVEAMQRKSHKECLFDSTGLPGFHLHLKPLVLEDELEVKVYEENKGQSWYQWERKEDFDASGPGDRHYTLDPTTGRLTFGNGIHGKIPPAGKEKIQITYYSSRGSQGNVAAGTITGLPDEYREKVKVCNPKSASGGTDAETLEQALHRAQKNLKKITRAVTSKDYEYLALHTPHCRVARAKALPGKYISPTNGWYSICPGTVTVLVLPKDNNNGEIDKNKFLEKVYKHLDDHRLLTTELFVRFPGWTKVSIKANVTVKPQFDENKINEEIKKELNRFLDPVKGGTEAKGWPFGRPVYRSEIYAVIREVDGVDYIENLELKKDDEEFGKGDIHIPFYHLVEVEPDNYHITIIQETGDQNER